MLRSFQLKLEPYDPDAKDGDGDGIVQEGTAWERPVGTRIITDLGTEVGRGDIRTQRPRNIRIVDRNNNTVDYTPTYQRGEDRVEEREATNLGSPSLTQRGLATLGSRSPTIGEQVRTARTPPPPEPPEEPQIVDSRTKVDALRQKLRDISQKRRDNPVFTVEEAKEALNDLLELYDMYADPDIPDAAFAPKGTTPEEAYRLREQIPGIVPNYADPWFGMGERDFAELGRFGREGIAGQGFREDMQRFADASQDMFDAVRQINTSLNFINGNQPINIADLPDDMLQELEKRLSVIQDPVRLANEMIDKHKVGFQKESTLQNMAFTITSEYVSPNLSETLNEIRRERLRRLNADLDESTEDLPPAGLIPTAPGYGQEKPTHPAIGPLTTTQDSYTYTAEDLYIAPGQNGAAATVEEAVQALVNGASLSEIPNAFIRQAILDPRVSSDQEYDPNTKFMAIRTSSGALGDTYLIYVRDKDGEALQQGFVIKGDTAENAAAERAGWNLAVALGLYPQGARSDGRGRLEAGYSKGEQGHYFVIPMVYNHLVDDTVHPNDDESIIMHGFGIGKTADQPDLGLPQRFHAHLFGWLLGHQDRHEGNVKNVRTRDGASYMMPLDFGISGDYSLDKDFFSWFGYNGKLTDAYFLREIEEHVERLERTQGPEAAQQFVQKLTATYDQTLKRGEDLLRNMSEEDFLRSLRLDPYSEMGQDLTTKYNVSDIKSLTESYRTLKKRIDHMRSEREDFLDRLVSNQPTNIGPNAVIAPSIL